MSQRADYAGAVVTCKAVDEYGAGLQVSGHLEALPDDLLDHVQPLGGMDIFLNFFLFDVLSIFGNGLETAYELLSRREAVVFPLHVVVKLLRLVAEVSVLGRRQHLVISSRVDEQFTGNLRELSKESDIVH